MDDRETSQFTIAVLVLFTIILSGPNALSNEPFVVIGQIVDEQDNPIPSASVILMEGGATVAGTYTDERGMFEIPLDHRLLDPRIRVTSVGHESVTLVPNRDAATRITLKTSLTEVEGMTVKPRREYPGRGKPYEATEIANAASASLIPSNPLAAIKSPTVARAGSSHSSTLRVHGTSPVYSLNGSPIGSDPAHYGTFAIIPEAMVDRMRFQSLGSDASHRLPTFVELETPSTFGPGRRGQASLSTIDANLFYQVSGKNAFLVGSLRKSVLDHLVNNLDLKSDRATLPPTNFNDLFVSGGVRLSREARLTFDNYRVDDFLFYNTTDAGVGGHSAVQQTAERYYAVRLELLSGPLLTRVNLSTRRSDRVYLAAPNSSRPNDGVNVDVGEHLVTNSGRVSLDYDFGNAQLSAGVEVEADIKREFNLRQTNWNFLPPFSSSDNPYIFQYALNNFLDHSSGRAESRATAGYLSWKYRLGLIELENGIRMEKFDRLEDGRQLLGRSRLSADLGEFGSLTLSAGSFAHSPVDNILEPFQILVREDLDRLSPIKSVVYSMRYRFGPLELAVFHKEITNLPLPTHDFDQPSIREMVYRRDFIRMESTGEVDARGINIAYDESGLLGDRVDLYAYYSYTSTYRVSYGLSIPYEFDAPHRFMTQVSFRPSSGISLGSELQIRSGYPYSPVREGSLFDGDANYTAESFTSVQSRENSQRFPVNAHLNVNAQYDMGRTIVSLSLLNVTNRANPIVSSRSGFVHDTGILPMLGLRFRF